MLAEIGAAVISDIYSDVTAMSVMGCHFVIDWQLIACLFVSVTPGSSVGECLGYSCLLSPSS